MAFNEVMSNSFSFKTFSHIFIIPVLMGLGHLAPAIGAIRAATGIYQFPVTLFGMIATGAALVDSYDSYKDVPITKRPPTWLWNIWFYSLWAITFVCTIYSGLKPAMMMYRFAFIGLGWGTPCVPCLTQNCGIRLCKPKYIFREAKSLVVAICMAYVTVDTSMIYFCSGSTTTQCSEPSFRGECLGLAIIYHFFRETVCDARDIAEDTEDGMKTLPIRLGRENTLCLMGILGTFVDATLTRGISINSAWGIYIDKFSLAEAILRVGMTMLFYSKVLEHHHGNVIAWGTASLIGLTPVIWAQQSLGR